MRFKLSIPGLALILLFSCHKSTTVRLMTDNLDAVSAVELFNKERNDFKIIVEYSKNLPKDITDEIPADLIIGENINIEPLAEKFLPLKKEWSGYQLYRPLCVDGTDKKTRLIPLAYTVPIIVFPDEYSQSLKNPIITTPEEIKELGKTFNKSANGSFIRIGFLPLRYDDFLYYTALYQNAGFEISNKNLYYQNDNINKTVEYFRNWITEANESTNKESRFQEKYGYIPDVKLLDDELILFSVMDINDFFLLAEHDQRPLDFRYLTYNNMIPIKNTVFIGVDSDSRKLKESLIFINWLLDPENQKNLIEYKLSRYMDSFGFFGGFSSLKDVNNQYLTKYYPELLGRIPDERYLPELSFISMNWTHIKSQVIVPWLRDYISGKTQKSLEDYYKDWLYYTVTD